MRALRARPSVAWLCVALAVLSGFVALPVDGACVLVHVWLGDPIVARADVLPEEPAPAERLLALLATRSPRAPPASTPIA